MTPATSHRRGTPAPGPALVHATSDENEQTTGTHVEAARRSVASWDGDLETLTVVRSAAGAAGYAITWTLRRGSPPRLEVTGPDEAEVSAYAATQEELLAPRLESMAAEDAAAAPPGQAGRIWPAMDALGTAIAIGISVVVVLAIAGAVWAGPRADRSPRLAAAAAPTVAGSTGHPQGAALHRSPRTRRQPRHEAAAFVDVLAVSSRHRRDARAGPSPSGRRGPTQRSVRRHR